MIKTKRRATTTVERAPRLAKGRRDSHGKRWDSLIWAGLRAIARDEGKSISWTIEEVFIRHFNLRHSPYWRKHEKARRRAK